MPQSVSIFILFLFCLPTFSDIYGTHIKSSFVDQQERKGENDFPSLPAITWIPYYVPSGWSGGESLIKRDLWVIGRDKKDFQMLASQDLRKGRGSCPRMERGAISKLLAAQAFLLRDPERPALLIAPLGSGDRGGAVSILFQG